MGLAQEKFALLPFMRVEAVDHAERMGVGLCVTETALRLTMTTMSRAGQA